jgi:hypothetical protein
MKGKYKRKKKGTDTSPQKNLTSMNTGEKQKHTREEEPKAETGKRENGINSVSKWWHDPAHVIQAIGILIGSVVAVIYGCQLRAMNENNRIGRENVEAVQSASVFFFGQVGYIPRLTGNKVATITIVVPRTNVGSTAAMNGESVVNWKTMPGNSDLPENFAYPDEAAPTKRQFEIPPKGFGNATIDVPVSWIQGTKSKSFRLFIHGWITYDDIFKGAERKRNTSRHLSEFCDEITNISSTPEDITDPTVKITSSELSLCREHNCTDAGCRDYKDKTQ